MCLPLLLILVVVPTLEIFTLFRVGTQIGFMPTMLIVLGTAFFGLAAVRGQGFAALERLRGGRPPVRAEVLEGPLLVAAAVLLLIPGFITDAMGLLLVIPPVRRAVAKRLSRRLGPPGDPTVIVIEQ